MENEVLKNVLEPALLNEENKKCKQCKYILLFAFTALLLVMVIVFFESKQVNVVPKQKPPEKALHSIPPTKEDFASTTAEYHQRILELGATLSKTSVEQEVSPKGESETTATSGPSSQGNSPNGGPHLYPPVY